MTDLSIIQGDEKTYNLSFVSGGEPQDITGAAVTMSVKKALSDSEYALQKVVTEHVDPTAGQASITLLDTETADLEVGAYFYDVEITGGAVATKTILRGRLDIVWQVTE